MKVAKPVKVPVLHRIVEVERRPQFHVAAMLGFPLGDARALLDEMAFWALVAKGLGEQGVIDEGISKARGELLVAGSFHAPGGVPLPASYVRAKLGKVDKRVSVVGPRFWHGQTATAPEPITTMPVDWAHAFGGPEFEQNPRGLGAAPVVKDGVSIHPLPTIERYGALVRSPAERPEPAGFSSMDVTFAQRRSRAGNYDKNWLEQHYPGLAPDMDPTYFNVAPQDQWIEGFFRGDEELLVENMHPERPRLEGRLPGLVGRCFITHRLPEGERFVEIPLRCDTVWLFPSLDAGVVIFHGSRPVAEDDAADVVHLVVACEEPGAPRGIEHYEEALRRRLDKDNATLAEMSDSDLMPARGSGVSPNLGELDMGRWLKSEYFLARNGRRGQERAFARARAQLEEDGLDPGAHGFGELPPEPEPPPLDDLDALAARMESDLDRAEEELKKLDARTSEGKGKAREAFAEMGLDYDAEMETRAKKGGGPPKFSAAAHLEELRAMAAAARSEGEPLEEVERKLAEPGFRADIEQQEEGMRDLYRQFAQYQPAAAAMDPEASERARIVVRLALETGESLAGRDFTGANLAGVRLAGVDLSGAFLEGTDLSGCDLSGANLDEAILVRANLRDANLSRARLRGANLGGAALHNAVFDEADLTDAVLSRAEVDGAYFSGATLTGVEWLEAKLGVIDFTGAVLGLSTFLKADLSGSQFAGADLADATFVECELGGADFSGAKLHKTTFVTCKGDRVSFRGAKLAQAVLVHGSSFPGADFSDADLRRANLRGTGVAGARFDRADLSGADLSDCDASGASFDRAVLQGAMMIRTQLGRASLKGANLLDALLSKARLAGADFTGANLYRADLSRVIGDAATTFAEAEVGHVRFLPKADVPPRIGGAS
jgi:uncharacterized protein YjbI with pentapeptide repeats